MRYLNHLRKSFKACLLLYRKLSVYSRLPVVQQAASLLMALVKINLAVTNPLNRRAVCCTAAEPSP
jgi:hypothetical protein